MTRRTAAHVGHYVLLITAACGATGCVPARDVDDAGVTDAIVLPDSELVRCPAIEAVAEAMTEVHRRQCTRAVECASDEHQSPEYDCWPQTERTRDYWCDGLADGTLVFHPEGIGPCFAALDALLASECRIPPGAPPSPLRQRVRTACRDTIVEDLEWNPGGLSPCNGGYCDEYGSHCVAAPTCGGECSTPNRSGAACGGTFSDCETGFHCDTASSRCVDTCTEDRECQVADPGTYCLAGRCQAGPERAGETCAVTMWGEHVCAPGLYCSRATDQCRWRAGPGEACIRSDGPQTCREFYFECSSETSTCVNPSGHCFDVGLGTVFGCTEDAPFCGVDGLCTADASRVECSSYDGGDACPTGFICDREPTLSHCALAVPRGGSCDESTRCDYGLTCVGGACVTVVPPWESCGARAACPMGYECDDAGSCIWTYVANYVSEIGEPCEYPCWEGACVDGICAWLTPGAPCDPDERQCPRGCDEETFRCNDYAFVGIDEPCDGTRICADDAFCVRQSVRFDGVDDHVCRPRC